jgi:hypothetical protein
MYVSMTRRISQLEKQSASGCDCDSSKRVSMYRRVRCASTAVTATTAVNPTIRACAATSHLIEVATFLRDRRRLRFLKVFTPNEGVSAKCVAVTPVARSTKLDREISSPYGLAHLCETARFALRHWSVAVEVPILPLRRWYARH